jgi:hypothetical protein
MIQYSGGTIIHRTFTPSSRQNLLDNVTQAISDAGWTTISGTPGSGSDVILESAAQNLGAKIRVHCNLGASFCAAFAMRALTGTTDSTFGYCQPLNTWRIIANKFAFHTFMTGQRREAGFTVARFICQRSQGSSAGTLLVSVPLAEALTATVRVDWVGTVRVGRTVKVRNRALFWESRITLGR